MSTSLLADSFTVGDQYAIKTYPHSEYSLLSLLSTKIPKQGWFLLKNKAVVTILWLERLSQRMDTGSRVTFRKSELPLQERSLTNIHHHIKMSLLCLRLVLMAQESPRL